MATLVTELESAKQTAKQETKTPLPENHPDKLQPPKENKEKMEKDVHSIENFPPEAQKIVRKDMELVTNLNVDLVKTHSELQVIPERVKPLLDFVTTLSSDQQESSFKPEDQQLMQQLDQLRDTLTTLPEQKTEERLLALVNAIKSTSFIQKDNTAYLKAVEMANQIRRAQASKISKILQRVTGFHQPKQPEFSDIEIGSQEQDLEFFLKLTIPSLRDKTESKSITLQQQAQAKIQDTVKQTLLGSSNIEDISQNLILAKQNLDQASYYQKLAQEISEINQKDKPKEQQEPLKPLPDIEQLTAETLRLEIKRILFTTDQQLQKKILATIKDIPSTKGTRQFEGWGIEGITPKTIWTPTELNRLYQEVTSSFSQLEQSLKNLALLTNLGIPSLKNLTRNMEQLKPVSEDRYKLLDNISLSFANSHDIFYHGVPAREARMNVLKTGQLQSRKIQEKTGGKSFFFIDEAAKKAGMSRNKSLDQEAEQICFYKNQLGENYAQNTSFAAGLFYTAISTREIFRNYGFFEVDGIHIFDRHNPEDGSHYDLTQGKEDKLVLSSLTLEDLENSYGKESVEAALKKFGDKLVLVQNNSTSVAWGTLEDTHTKEAQVARIVPTGVLMDGPASKRDIQIYQLFYH